MTDSLPVLVVGAGPTGLALATELRRAGVACRVVDKQADRPSEQARALTVWPGALDVLARHGIADQVREQAIALAASRYYCDGRLLATVPFEAPGPVPLCLPQPALERLQRQRLANLGTVVEWNTRLVALNQTDELAQAVVEGPGGAEIIRARYVVGCDGIHSAVRDLAGIGHEGETYPRGFVLADGTITGAGADDEVHYHLHRDGVLVVVPLPGGQRRVFADATRLIGTSTDRQLTREELQSIVDERCSYRLQIDDLVWNTTFRVHLQGARSYRSGRVLLAGDSAHSHSPAGGQGMNTGIQDAANLGWRLAQLIHGADDEAGLLGGYQAERAPVARTVMAAADRQTRLWNLRSALARRARNLGLRFIAGRGVIQHKIVPAMAQDDLDYTAAQPLGSNGGLRGVGTTVPDTLLHFADGTTDPLGSWLRRQPNPVVVAWAQRGDDLAELFEHPAVQQRRVTALLLTGSAGLADRLIGSHPTATVATIPAGHRPVSRLTGCRLLLIRPDGYVAAASARLDVGCVLRSVRPAQVPAAQWSTPQSSTPKSFEPHSSEPHSSEPDSSENQSTAAPSADNRAVEYA